MLTRVTALVLASVLLWSGLGSIEMPHAPAQPSPALAHAAAHAGAQASLHEGSVEHHHLDDLPSQVQGEPATETPGLLPAALLPMAQTSAVAQPPGFVSAGTGPPFLAGPLRPPCVAALAG